MILLLPCRQSLGAASTCAACHRTTNDSYSTFSEALLNLFQVGLGYHAGTRGATAQQLKSSRARLARFESGWARCVPSRHEPLHRPSWGNST